MDSVVGKRRSTAEARRTVVLSRAVETFAVGGWAGTTITDVANAAGISAAYVMKLFPAKEGLFVAALEQCFAEIEQVLMTAADDVPGAGPQAVLGSMAAAYARLVGNRSLLMMQVHAQSATFVPAINQALRAGLARIVELVSVRSGADDAAVQRFFALGQLCHLIVTTGIADDDGHWARLLSAGILHYEADGTNS